MLNYSILVLGQDGWMFTWKRKKKILIGKVARIVTPTLTSTLSLSIDCASFVKYLVYIFCKYYKIFPWKKISQEHVFATLWPILENVTSGKLKRGRNIVKRKLNNI